MNACMLYGRLSAAGTPLQVNGQRFAVVGVRGLLVRSAIRFIRFSITRANGN
jgi:hypothetical protein